MKITVDDDFNLDAIAESGQCFRWHKNSDGSYNIISQEKILCIRQSQNSKVIECSCTEEEFQSFWYDYFDMKTCYQDIRKSVPKTDPFLFAAAQQEIGIRILHQDPWEMLITFIISQRKSIPAIKKAVEALCSKAGRRIEGPSGTLMYAFPTATELEKLSIEELNECGLGYRSRYVYEVAQMVSTKRFDMTAIQSLDDAALFQILQTLTGVGKKVANCVMLFGYHRLNAFPQDVWINRILDEKYPDGFSFTAYKPYNGVMQQYMFEFYRRHIN